VPRTRSTGTSRRFDQMAPPEHVSQPAALPWRYRPAYVVAGYRRSVPVMTISTWRLPQREPTSRSRQSEMPVRAPYRRACSAGLGSIDNGNPSTTRSTGPRRRCRAYLAGWARISSNRAAFAFSYAGICSNLTLRSGRSHERKSAILGRANEHHAG